MRKRKRPLRDADGGVVFDRRLEEKAQGVGGAVGKALDGLPFVLLVGNAWRSRGWGTYVSNGVRADVILWLRETADRLEAREDVEPTTGAAILPDRPAE